MKISEIFSSLQGESSSNGLMTTFIRSYGCKNNCSWCDTKYSFGGVFSELTPEKIAETAVGMGNRYICITGGEPLEQNEEVIELVKIIGKNPKYTISIETNGFIPVNNIPENVHIVMDYKLPSSNSAYDKNYYFQLKYTDELKLVIASYTDFYYAVEILEDFSKIIPYENIIFSPVPALYNWLPNKIIEYKLPVRLGIQLHKIFDFK